MRLFNKRYLIENLCFMYGVIIASAPLLEFAISHLEDGDLQDYYRRHLTQETGHDQMLLNDLAGLGITDVAEYHQAAQIAGSQYYLVAHDHPALLLGYMHFLESNALNEEMVASIEAHHGVDLECLYHHAKADPAHTKELEAQISKLDAKLRERVIWNERATARFFNSVIELLWIDAQEAA